MFDKMRCDRAAEDNKRNVRFIALSAMIYSWRSIDGHIFGRALAETSLIRFLLNFHLRLRTNTSALHQSRCNEARAVAASLRRKRRVSA